MYLQEYWETVASNLLHKADSNLLLPPFIVTMENESLIEQATQISLLISFCII